MARIIYKSHDNITVIVIQSHVIEKNIEYSGRIMSYSVVATTHHSRTNDLTTSKAFQWAIK